ncbi:hypothetical protein ABIB80_007053 [Bradyrhizobium sp. i1.15.2]
MCDACKELDEIISHYQRLSAFPFDPLTAKRIIGVVADLQQKRDAMHPIVLPSLKLSR